MRRTEDDWEWPVYQAIWEREGKQFLVVFEHQRDGRWPGMYNVFVFDHSMTLVRDGVLYTFGVLPSAIPYCLIEAKRDKPTPDVVGDALYVGLVPQASSPASLFRFDGDHRLVTERGGRVLPIAWRSGYADRAGDKDRLYWAEPGGPP